MQGVYLVAAELSRLGFIVSPTSRSAIAADLLVTNPACTRTYSVQVKTNATTFGFFLVGAHARKLKSDSLIYVLVNLRREGPEYFVVPSVALAKCVRSKQRANSVWTAVRRTSIEQFRDGWQSFGAAD
jgi:hypothetical protein